MGTQELHDSNQQTRPYPALEHGDEYSYPGSQQRQEVFDVDIYQESSDSSSLHNFKIGNFERSADGKFSCDKCEYKTNISWNLKTHQLGKYEGVKFKCNQCHREFSQKSNLQTHIYSKHEGKKYSCDMCN